MKLVQIKRALIPPASRREAAYVELVQLARLYLRDGLPGVVDWAKVKVQGGKLLVPAWWLVVRADASDWLESWQADAGTTHGDVILYSGLPYNPDTGQRATWLARAFARRGYRVLITGLRWSPSEQITPAHPETGITQVALDAFWRSAATVFAQPAPSNRPRLFIAEFPHPSLFNLINLTGSHGWRSVYDCIDDWEEFHHAGQAAWYDPQMEVYLAGQVDQVVATARALVDKLADRTGRLVTYLPNAYSPDTLNGPAEPVTLERGALTLGYFGHLTPAWFDWELVIQVARQQPDWRIHLIGDLAGAYQGPLPGNMICHGRVAHHRLSAYARQWDVATIPFRSSRLTGAVDPIKVYEYLALGLPVVATGFPHLSSLPGVRNADGAAEFIHTAQELAQTAFPSATVEQFLQDNTWEKRVADLEALVTEGIK